MDRQAAPKSGYIIAGGAAAALLAGGAIAWMINAGHGREPRTPPPASQGGLVIDTSQPPDTRVAPTKTLRCFVAGKYVGDFTLVQCAQRNGVATDALDVGVDQTGALSAAQQGTAQVTPLPPPGAKPEPKPVTASAPVGACWRYEGSWRKLPDMTLNACVSTLFAGRCEKPGEAAYGRWGQETVRLVPGKVEISADNHTFHTLLEQGSGCAVPAAG
ncbi:MAG: hypothetical protein KGO51_16770 [Alphaproteobacteria bacterium]|nr:hypothetical protein [Alphaproteobacteria bacterium]